MSSAVRVWDLPTRIFHWLLAFSVLALFITAQIGGSAMDWHFRFGYLILVLLLFRLAWGLLGGFWSRFSSVRFVFPTRRRAEFHRSAGHSLQGWLSVIAMLFFLLVQVASGLISDDEIATTGPFSHLVSSDLVSVATYYHAEIGKLVLLFLVSLHLAAVLYYRLHHHQDLLRPMLFGDKPAPPDLPASRDDHRSRGLALLVFASCCSLVLMALWMA